MTITGALADDLEREVMELLGPMGERLQDEADAILEEAKKNWPRKTGRSAEAWRTELTVNPGTWEVEVSMLNSADHTKYIKSTKVGTKDDATRIRSPLQEHVRKPARASKKQLKRDLPELLAKAIEDAWTKG